VNIPDSGGVEGGSKCCLRVASLSGLGDFANIDYSINSDTAQARYERMLVDAFIAKGVEHRCIIQAKYLTYIIYSGESKLATA